MTDHDQKEAFKEAIREWLDDRFASFGRWTLGSILGVMFAWFIYGLLRLNGWHQ